MKVYLDEDLTPAIATALRRQNIDAVSAHDVGNLQQPDAGQLAYATREGRALVTRNVGDFLVLDREAVRANTDHAGIILVPAGFRGDEVGPIARAIARVAEHYPRGLHGTVIFLAREAG